jgi:hypothetical protein
MHSKSAEKEQGALNKMLRSSFAESVDGIQKDTNQEGGKESEVKQILHHHIMLHKVKTVCEQHGLIMGMTVCISRDGCKEEWF